MKKHTQFFNELLIEHEKLMELYLRTTNPVIKKIIEWTDRMTLFFMKIERNK